MTEAQASQLMPGDIVQVYEVSDSGGRWWRAKVHLVMRPLVGVPEPPTYIRARRQWTGPAHHNNDGFVKRTSSYPLHRVRLVGDDQEALA